MADAGATLAQRAGEVGRGQLDRVPVLGRRVVDRAGPRPRVPAGSLFRLSTPQGPQVGDLNIWNAHDPRERFWAARTRQLQSSHVGEGDRLWSCLPFMRPLCGVIDDGCRLGDRQGGRDGRGKEKTRWDGRCHDLLGTRCDPYGTFIYFFPFLIPFMCPWRKGVRREESGRRIKGKCLRLI